MATKVSAAASTNINNPEYWRPEHDEMSDKDKFISKAKKDPFVPVGKNFIKELFSSLPNSQLVISACSWLYYDTVKKLA